MQFSSYIIAAGFLASAFAAPVAQIPSAQPTGSSVQPTGDFGGGDGSASSGQRPTGSFGRGGGRGGHHRPTGGLGGASISRGGGGGAGGGASATQSMPGVFPSGTQPVGTGFSSQPTGTAVPSMSIPDIPASTTDAVPPAVPTTSFLSPESSAEGFTVLPSDTALPTDTTLPTVTARQMPTGSVVPISSLLSFSVPYGGGSSGFFSSIPTGTGCFGFGPKASNSNNPFGSGIASLTPQTSLPALSARQFGQPSGMSFSFGGPQPTGTFPGFGGSACGMPTFSGSVPTGTGFSIPVATDTTAAPFPSISAASTMMSASDTVPSAASSSFSYLTASDATLSSAVPSVAAPSSAVATSALTLTMK